MNVDELTELELIAAFARAMGYKVLGQTRFMTVDGPRDAIEVSKEKIGVTAWTELPADLIIDCFNRIKPNVWWAKYSSENQYLCNIEDPWSRARTRGPDFKTAMARLVLKLANHET